jgi:hypothetical protein
MRKNGTRGFLALFALLVACTPTPRGSVSSASEAREALVWITPAYPVVRDGAPVVAGAAPVAFSKAFLAQQRAAFADDPSTEAERLTRYELGKIAHHEPESAFGAVSEQAPGVPEPRAIAFGQASVTRTFGDGGGEVTTEVVETEGALERRGRALEVVAEELRRGVRTPDDLPISVFHYVDTDGGTHWVTLNNRSLTVLRLAKLEPTKIRFVPRSELAAATGQDALAPVLNRLVAMPGRKPSRVMFVRVDGLNDLGEARRSWNWDAPFGYAVR